MILLEGKEISLKEASELAIERLRYYEKQWEEYVRREANDLDDEKSNDN